MYINGLVLQRFENILNELEKQLEHLEVDNKDELLISENAIRVVKQALHDLRNEILQKGFIDEKEEIQFFKHIKPQVYSKLIYYVKLFNVESKKPRGSRKSQVKYLNEHISRLQLFFNDNLEFYHYYRRNSTAFDKQYFVRGMADIRLAIDSYHFFTDEEFSTSHDSVVATIMAYDMLIVHLKKEIDKIENNQYMENNTSLYTNLNTKLFWTSSKTDLIELIYALQSCGAINSGTADLKEIALTFEKIFNVELGDYYRTFLELKSRKTGQTKFIDVLKNSLESRIQEGEK
ncbi:RteC domain-containing protein [Flagellimonas meridianipacifica]|uniref:RteC protein n=1 Tax=Flagellimonas meridianipacifica TaxID=1080225 RepID=A0A2T0MIP3_9FLAO|nr:RteC domain-containing protein [Allomuricauda pacifica]PRX57376.1 RteC protein [Allomuricauda pacifica]